jgi:hypothetical protein
MTPLAPSALSNSASQYPAPAPNDSTRRRLVAILPALAVLVQPIPPWSPSPLPTPTAPSLREVPHETALQQVTMASNASAVGTEKAYLIWSDCGDLASFRSLIQLQSSDLLAGCEFGSTCNHSFVNCSQPPLERGYRTAASISVCLGHASIRAHRAGC